MTTLAPQPGKQTLAMNVRDKNGNIPTVMIYGGAAGSGKSRLLLTKAAYYAYQDPDFAGVMFRRTSPPLKAAGGLFTEAKKLFSPFGTKVREKDMEILFQKTSGGNLKFTHLEHENDAEGNHQGLQYSFIGFDELTHFSITQFIYLIGRLRSESAEDSFVLGTTNPDPDSWVFDWVEYYLREDGTPDESKCGQVRYFVIVEDKPVFADDEETLVKEYPELCWVHNPNTGEEVYVPPMTFCFVSGNIFDNPALIKSNPKYLSSLKAQTKVNRSRLLDGNWLARPEGSEMVKRADFKKAESVPFGAWGVRAWDKAYSEPSDKYRFPDYTASIKLYRTQKNLFYVVADFHPDNIDPKSEIYGRFRKTAGIRDQWIQRQAEMDGEDCKIILPRESGSGVAEYEAMSASLNACGFQVASMPTNTKKMQRYATFASAVKNGSIYIVEGSFPNKATLDAFYKELESFDGERSTATKKDDWCDAMSDAYNYISKKKHIPSFSMPKIDAPTIKQKSGL